MQALLSYEQSPPLAAPFRFFLTAPCCGVLAGLLLIVYGEDALVMRWTPAALALTHAVTAGLMLQATGVQEVLKLLLVWLLVLFASSVACYLVAGSATASGARANDGSPARPAPAGEPAAGGDDGR